MEEIRIKNIAVGDRELRRSLISKKKKTQEGEKNDVPIIYYIMIKEVQSKRIPRTSYSS